MSQTGFGSFNAETLLDKPLGEYIPRRILGGTQKSNIILAEDPNLERVVAIKILKPGQGPEREKQFLKEGRRLAGLKKHEALASAYAAGKDGEIFYLVMEYVEGPNLQEIIDTSPKVIYPFRDGLKMMVDLSEAVALVHSTGLEHRDIKPANVKIKERDRRACLVDLGDRLSDPPYNDIGATGIVFELFLKHMEPSTKANGHLENIVQRAKNEEYQKAEELKADLANYWRRTDPEREEDRRAFLKVGLNFLGFGIGVSSLILWGSSINVERKEKRAAKKRYEMSIDSTLDELKKVSPADHEAMIPCFKKLEIKIAEQKVKKLANADNLRVKNGREKLRYPYVISPGTDQWSTTGGTCWTDGEWIRILFASYDATGDEELKDNALEYAKAMRFGKFDNLTINAHRFYSHAVGYDQTGDPDLRKNALAAADYLLKRFNPNGGYFQLARALSTETTQINYIESLTTILPLLSWRYNQTLEADIFEKVSSHCNVCLECNLNSDGSVLQAAEFDSKTGKKIRGVKSHGFDENSCHSRSQASAIEGFLMAYTITGDKKYLRASESCAHYFTSNLPKSKVPLSDFKGPLANSPGLIIPEDSSASGIASRGLLRLSKKSSTEDYRGQAIDILRALPLGGYLSRDPEYQGFLLHACTNMNKGVNTDVSVIYGCSSFVEALREL
jgi:unsaturated chondroitin disaccharide hydrolase